MPENVTKKDAIFRHDTIQRNNYTPHEHILRDVVKLALVWLGTLSL